MTNVKFSLMMLGSGFLNRWTFLEIFSEITHGRYEKEGKLGREKIWATM